MFDSIDNLLSDEKEQKLRSKLGKELCNCIFTNDVIEKLNENDLTGLVDEEEEITTLFSMIFPVFVQKNNFIFRLYKHKIEVDLSNEMSDRYIYMFSDGRLTSGLFQCFKLYDKEYVYGIKQIIQIIPDFRKAIKDELVNLDRKGEIQKQKVNRFNDSELIAEKNYNELIEILNTFK